MGSRRGVGLFWNTSPFISLSVVPSPLLFFCVVSFFASSLLFLAPGSPVWCFCFPSSTPGWSCVYFRTPWSLTLWFILTPNRAPSSICFLCFRYLLIFHAFAFSFLPYFAISSSLVGFQPLYLMLIACLSTPSFLLFMLFTLSIVLKFFVSPAHVLCRFHVLYVIDELSGGDNLFFYTLDTRL